MIVVNVVIESHADDIATMQAAIARMEEHSRAEPGCQDYTFSVELNNPAVLRVTERWDTEDALAAHTRTPHMADFRAAMAAHKPKSMRGSFYRAAEFSPPWM